MNIKIILPDISSIIFSHLLVGWFVSSYSAINWDLKMEGLGVNLICYLFLAFIFKLTKEIRGHFDSRDSFQRMSLISLAFLGESLLFFLQKGSLLFVLATLTCALGLVFFMGIVTTLLAEKKEVSQISRQESLSLLIVGAGYVSELLIETLQKKRNQKYVKIVGAVDDNLSLADKRIFGIDILGTTEDIPKLIQKKQIDRVIVAISSLPKEKYSQIVSVCQKNGAEVIKLPSLEEITLGEIHLDNLDSLETKNLLGRAEVNLESPEMKEQLFDKTILITGAGGSIGSEICRHILKFKPKRIVLLGHGENSIYLIHQELLSLNTSTELIPVIADIQDFQKMQEVMENHRPQIIYHAAAHKHVPLMEANPKETLKNNIYGTKNVAFAAKQYGVEKFVMISTDKAVNPPNIMGASKRISEMIITELNEPGKTKFCAVRFGNVLGSRGSVVPLFKKQIEQGGPVTITDKRMTRYFMTIPEASRLVIQAGCLAQGGEIFILDMGQPVKIMDLAENMIRLAGYRKNEIPILEVGIRPGEKLYEELLVNKERAEKQIYEKIYLGKVNGFDQETIENFLRGLNHLPDEKIKSEMIFFANYSGDNRLKGRKAYEESESYLASLAPHES